MECKTFASIDFSAQQSPGIDRQITLCLAVWYLLKQPFVQAEMQGSPDTAAILEALQATKATAKERHAEMERKIRQVSICLHSLCIGEECLSNLSPILLMKTLQVQIVQLM